MNKRMKIPTRNMDRKELLQLMTEAKRGDADWRSGRCWSLVYHGGEEHAEFLKEVYGLFFSENGLSPTAFPSLRKFESEVVSMVLDLLGSEGEEVGTMTSGGTESILLAVKSYRDWARVHKPEIRQPEILVPESAHPAFLKAALYFDVKAVSVPVDNEFRTDLVALRGKLTEQTICIIASAPTYPQGVIDPVEEMATLAAERGVGLHIDACLGGFLLPFLRRLGYPIPLFDFRLPGVTSISTDLHKNGYAAKGASAILYRHAELRHFQFFVETNWPGGLYGSPTMVGTRPGGAIAAAWAALMSLGEEGYLKLAQQTMDATKRLMKGICAIPGLSIIGNPDMSVFSFTSEQCDIFRVAEWMEKKGWRLDRQRNPNCLHMIVTPNHVQAIEPFIMDLREAVAEERRNPGHDKQDKITMLYGVTAKVPSSSNLKEIILANMDETYRIS